ncbi:MAG TPA: hypothetical protein VEC60_07515 [Reyranella sp.]|nr:hypothetical protein [Reyranella sp.]
MRIVVFAGAACILAALTAACAEPPVKPIPDANRKSITAVSADVSGVRESDTSKLGARGADEGARLGALQGAATVLSNSSGSLLGLVLAPIGAAVGSAKGGSEARSPEVVDETRANLRLALQDSDFTELLRQRLAASGAGPVRFATVTAGPSSAPAVTGAGLPVGHVIALEYRLHLYNEYFVNPLVGVFVRVTAQVQSPDRKQVVHTATWHYCGDRADFVQMAANNAAGFRAEIDRAAAVLGEAIPYDLYVSQKPRPLQARQLGHLNIYAGCMDFSDLPSRTGQPIPVAAAPPAPQSAPVAVTPASAAPATDFDGTWTVEMRLSNNAGSMMGGECPTRHSLPVTLVNGSAEGPWGKVTLTRDGEVSGWMRVDTAASTASVQLIVNMAGRMDNGVVRGTMTGRCTGAFVMKKQ